MGMIRSALWAFCLAMVVLWTPELLAQTSTTYYRAPYTLSGTYYADGQYASVGQAASAWWAGYRIYWNRNYLSWKGPLEENCSYTIATSTPTADNPQVAGFILGGYCGGGNGLWATVYTYDPGKNLGPPCNCVGDPINFGTGNEYRDDADISLGRLSLHRYYNSHQAVSSAHFGSHWRHSSDRSLEYVHETPLDTAIVFRPDGRQVTFTLKSGAWTSDADVADTLSATYDASNNIVGWTYVSAATREQENFDAQGRLLSITDVNKQLTTFTYSNASTPTSVAPIAGLLLTVSDPLGRQLAFTYNSQSNVATVTQPDGGVTSYSYDAIGNLSQVTYSDSKYRQYTYNESALTANTNLPSALTGEIDEQGTRVVDIGYDSQGRAVLSRLAGSVNVNQVSYGSGGTSIVTYPSGAQVTYGFTTPSGSVRANSASGPCGQQCDQRNASSTFDANGYPASATDFNGHVTQSTYSSKGLLNVQIEAAGEGSQRTTTTTWDAANRVPLARVVTDGSGVLQTSTAWIYNVRAQVVARCDIDPKVTGYTCAVTGTPPAGVRRTINTYCDAVDSTQCPLVGLMLSTTGPRTDITSTTHYTYYLSTDESGCGTTGGACHRAGDLYQVIDPAGHVNTIVAYDKNGRIARVRNANSVFIDSSYHARGWLLTRTIRANADGTPSPNDAVTQIGYTPYGAVASVKDPDGVQVTYTYDAAHRLTDITDALGNRIHYTLDAAGNKTKEETFDTGGTLRRSLGRTYNMLGQLTGIKDGLNRTVFDASFSDSYDGNGNLVRSADALGIQRKQGFDALGRLVSAIDNYNGLDPATQNTQSVFAYGTRDELLGAGDPDGTNTTYDYDGLGNRTAAHSPDTGTSTYIYDAAGNRIQATNARNIVSQNAFDVLNRITRTTYPNSASNVSYRYDEADMITGCAGSYPIGRLTSIVEVAVTTTYCYDAHGNVTQKRQSQGGSVDTTSYTYTAADRLVSTRTPDGTSIQYTWDGAGRIAAIAVVPAGSGGTAAYNVATNVSYLPFGPITSYTLGSGQTVIRSYDANYALTDVVSPVLNLHFTRDVMGNIIALGNTPGANPAIETYTYDPLYRLTGLKDAQGQAIEAYTYNKTGDRLSKTSSGLATGLYSYQANTHWLTGIGSSARTYDDSGNTVGVASAGGAFGYGYDDRDRLTVVQRNGQSIATYGYNALGQRIAKAGATTQRFAYNERNQIIGEYGALSRNYVWLDSLPVAVIDTSGGTSTVSYVHADGLGTPRSATNSTGAITWQWTYQSNPFGEKLPSSSGLILNLRFPGQYYDAESALVYNSYRDYDPSVGRYIQSDPIGLGGGFSTYSYVSNNPLSYSDSQGLLLDPTGAYVGTSLAAGATGTSVAVAATGVGAAALIGTGIGMGFNYAWEHVAGQPLGGSIYDWTHPQASNPQDSSGTESSPSPSADTLAQQIEKGANWEEVHRICDEPPPTNLDDCGLGKWKLTKALRCKRVREAMADRWFGGTYDDGHAIRMREVENEIATQRRAVDRICRRCP